MSTNGFSDVFGDGRGLSPLSPRRLLMEPGRFVSQRAQLIVELRQEIATGDCLRATVLLNSDYDASQGLGAPKPGVSSEALPDEAHEFADLIATSMNSRRMKHLYDFTKSIWWTLHGNNADQKDLDAFFDSFLSRENETDAGLLIWSAYRSICTEDTFTSLFYPVDMDLLAKDDLEGVSDARSRYIKALADCVNAQHDAVFSTLDLELAPNHIQHEDPTCMWQYCLSAVLAQWVSDPQATTRANVQKHAGFWLCGMEAEPLSNAA